MDGVASVLDDKHFAMVENLWDEFKEKFGVHGIAKTPIPHFSYHVAQRYDHEHLEKLLRRMATDIEPFTVKTNGLGIFTGSAFPVLYIPVIRNYDLTTFHNRMWQAVSEWAQDTSDYYHPDNWRPHITLTHHDVSHELLPQVVSLLSKRSFNWEIRVENIALISGEEEIHSVKFKIPL